MKFFCMALLVGALLTPTSFCFAQQTSREDFQEFCKAIEGRWIGATTLVTDSTFGKQGEQVTTQFSSVLAADGNVLIGTFQAGQGTGTWVVTYDPGAKQIRTIWASAGGDFSAETIAKESGKWVERSEGSKADGKSWSQVQVLTISDGGDTHTWVDSGTIDGKPYDDSTTVWKRIYKP